MGNQDRVEWYFKGGLIMDNDTVLQIINQQKDKMTSEQFWCVVLLSGVFSALILNRSDIVPTIPGWAVIVLSVMAAAWGIGFVRSRHTNYVELQETFARLVAEEKDVPPGWRSKPKHLQKTKRWRYFFSEYTQGHGSYMIILAILLVTVVWCYV